MTHKATMTASILVQDLSGPVPVTVAQNEKVDQVVDLEEFTSSVVVIPPNTDVAVSPVIVNFSPFQVQTVFVKSSRPVTMRVGSTGADTLNVRSAYAETYVDGDGPDQLKFGNTDMTNSAVVTVVAGSNQP